jgi:hypothetical protein
LWVQVWGTYGGCVSDAKGTSDVITENQFFKILGEQGVLGLVLMFAMIRRLRTPGSEAGSEAGSSGSVAVPASIAAVLTYCLLGNILDGRIVAVPFWTIAGMRMAEPRRTQQVLAYAWPTRGRASHELAFTTWDIH